MNQPVVGFAGMSHLGLPILRPERAPAGVPIYLALAPAQVEDAKRRLTGRGLRVIAPPPFDELRTSGPAT